MSAQSLPLESVPAVEAVAEPQAAAPRLYYLDWLRLIAIVGVFAYHASNPFMQLDWLILNESRSDALTAFFAVFLGSFGMPVFFLIAGAGSYFALRRRTGRQFAVERVRRLVIPFIVGVILLSPIQYYLEWLHKGWYEGAFLPFLPLLLQNRVREMANNPGPVVFRTLGLHLWFLGFLFTFSLLTLPLFLSLKQGSLRAVRLRIGALGDVRGGLFLLIIPVALARILLQPRSHGYTDWADFTFMLIFFIYGFLIYGDGRLVRAIRRDAKLALFLGLGITAVIIGLLLFAGGREWIRDPSSLGFALGWGLAAANGFCWTIFVLAVAMRYVNRSTKGLEYGQEALVPFYIFHMPVIVAIAFFVVEWQAGIAVKWPAIAFSSLLLTLALYEVVLRRLGPARALFGMRR